MHQHEKAAVLMIAADEVQKVLDASSTEMTVGKPIRTGSYDKSGRWVPEARLVATFMDNEQDIHELVVTFTYSRRL